jgi:hypothetical protein
LLYKHVADVAGRASHCYHCGSLPFISRMMIAFFANRLFDFQQAKKKPKTDKKSISPLYHIVYYTTLRRQ